MKRILLAAAAVAAVGSIGLAAPATAADNTDKILTSTSSDEVSSAAATCSDLYWCIWRDPNATGNTYRYSWFGSDGNYANNHWGSVTVSNKASGVWNQGNQQFVVIYDGPDRTGNYACVPRNTRVPDLRLSDTGDTPVGWWNDRISSHRWSNTCSR